MIAAAVASRSCAMISSLRVVSLGNKVIQVLVTRARNTSAPFQAATQLAGIGIRRAGTQRLPNACVQRGARVAQARFDAQRHRSSPDVGARALEPRVLAAGKSRSLRTFDC